MCEMTYFLCTLIKKNNVARRQSINQEFKRQSALFELLAFATVDKSSKCSRAIKRLYSCEIDDYGQWWN